MDNLENTTREEKFFNGVINGEDKHTAAVKAGYEVTNITDTAYSKLSLPQVRKHFKKIIIGRGETEGIAASYDLLIKVIRDEKKDIKIRVECAKFIYGQHIPAAKAQEVANTDSKDVSEMNNMELHDFVVGMEEELKSRLKQTQGVDDMI